MNTIYKLTVIRPDNISESYNLPSLPNYTVGQIFQLNHSDENDHLNPDNEQTFKIDQIFHSIDTIKLSDIGNLVVVSMVLWLIENE